MFRRIQVSKSKKLLDNLVTLTILPLAALSIALASLNGLSLCRDGSVDEAMRYLGKVCSFVVESFFNLFFGSVSTVLY